MSTLRRNALVICTLFVTSCICFTVKAEEAVPGAAEMLPDGTVMFVEVAPWGNWSKDFSKTSLAQIFSEPEIKTFLAGPFNQLSYLIRRSLADTPAPTVKGPDAVPAPPLPPNGQPGGIVTTAFAFLDTVAPGPVMLAVRYSKEDAQAKRPPAAAIMLGIARDKTVESTHSMIAMVLENFVRNYKIESMVVSEYQSCQLISLKLETEAGPRTFTATLNKGRVLLTTEVDFCKQIIDGMAGTATKKLSENEMYKNSGLTGNEHLSAYLDVAGLQAALGSVPAAADAPHQLDDLFVLSGLNKTIAVAWSLKMNGQAFESRTAIYSKGEREGLLGTLDDAPVSDESLKIIPANAPFAVGFRLKPERIMPFIRNSVRAMQGQEGLKFLNDLEKQLNKELGRDLEKDIRAAFGNEIIFASLPNTDNAIPLGMGSFLASISVQDMRKADELVNNVLTRVATKAGLLKELDFEDTKIRYLPLDKIGGIFDFSPSFALKDNRLVVAPDVPALKRALAGLKDGAGLVGGENFKNALAGVGGKMGPAFSYVDWAQIYRSTFNMASTALKVLAPADVLKQMGIDMNLMPTTESVTRHLFPGLTVARFNANGVMLSSRSPLPSLEVLSPPAAALGSVFASFKPLLSSKK